jgi:hypothetical protein
MSSLPQNSAPPPQSVKAQSSNSNFDLEDWDRYSSQKLWKSQKHEEHLSFRGMSLERERFSVCCGLQGIYVPGRRWWRKLEIIQPVEIHSFAADCNTDDLLCVQIKVCIKNFTMPNFVMCSYIWCQIPPILINLKVILQNISPEHYRILWYT